MVKQGADESEADCPSVTQQVGGQHPQYGAQVPVSSHGLNKLLNAGVSSPWLSIDKKDSWVIRGNLMVNDTKNSQYLHITFRMFPTLRRTWATDTRKRETETSSAISDNQSMVF